MIEIDEKLLRELSDTQPRVREEAYAGLRDYCLGIARIMAWPTSGIDPEDLTQTVLARIILAGDCRKYKPSLSCPETYIKTIIRRSHVDMLRAKGARITAGHLEDYAGPRLRSEGYIPPEQKERNAILRAAVDGLVPSRRRVVELAYFWGRSLSEISKILDIPPGTVKSHLNRALVNLRGALKDRG